MNSGMRSVFSLWVSIVLTMGLSACAQRTDLPPQIGSSFAATDLPVPRRSSAISLEEALLRRRSVRSFSSLSLTTAEIGQLLWAAQGTTSERGFRTAPSAGALYPLEFYVATADGVFRFDPLGHRLLTVDTVDRRDELCGAALGQDAVLHAPAVFIVTAVYERTERKYGPERAPRYVHLEAGHAAQNLLLQAVALELGAVTIGAFHDEQVLRALGLPLDHAPLYLIPTGHPAES